MAHREFSEHDPDIKTASDESAPTPVAMARPMAPMSKLKCSTSSGGSPRGSSRTASYVGVRYRWQLKKWVAEIRSPNRKGNKISLGPYSTALEAAYARDVAVTCLGSSKLVLNFNHPIYKQIPRISPDLSPLAFSSELKKVVKEFGKLAMEAENSGELEQEELLKGLLDEGTLLNSGTQQSVCTLSNHNLDTFQKNKRRRISDMLEQEETLKDLLDGDFPEDYFPHQLDDETTEDISIFQKAGVLMAELLPLPPSISAPDISDAWLTLELANTRNKQPYQPLSPSPDMLSGSPDGALKFTSLGALADLNLLAGNFSESRTIGQQAGDLDTFQKYKRRCFNDISCSDGDFPEDYFPDDETTEDISKVQKAEVEWLGMRSPYSSTISAPGISNAWPTIEPANTRNKQPYQPIFPGHDILSGSPDGALKFTMADLNIITGNFSESLTVGQGGFGSVYRGQLKDGTTVAVKRIKKNDKNVLEIEDAKDFQTEADTLSKEKHLNLVTLLGFLEDEFEYILVTEYVTNGNLRQHLAGIPYGVILDMSKRCRISLDVVAALKHLHNQTKDDLHIIHRAIKSSNILITADFRAKVAGFGLSRRSPFGDVGASSSSTQVKGTLGYMAPEHLRTHHLNERNDVYSFGELLAEIFVGTHVVESSLPNDECFTPRWALKQCAEGRLMDIIDPRIAPTTFNLKILEQIFKLAASCLVLEERNRPTVGDVFLQLSLIVGLYLGDFEHQLNSKGDNYEVQKEQEWDLKGCIEPNLQALCLEESEALEGQEPTKHLDRIDSSNPSLMLAKPHGSLLVEGSRSKNVQTSAQLDTQLDVKSKQATRQALEPLVAKQDQTSPLFIDIIPDVFQLKSDETYFEMLQEEIAKLGYISRLLNQDDDFEPNMTNIGKTSFFLYFNEKDNVFEFYFKNYQGMASIVGVGLECAKVILEDGWRVTIQEISKQNWDDAWKNFDSSSRTMKVTILEPLEEGMDSIEDSQELVASIPRGQCLLLDLAQYFILKMAIASFPSRVSMTHVNTDSGTSSSPSSQDIARSSSSSDQKPSRFLQAMKSIFISKEACNQLKTKNGDGTPMDAPGEDVKIDTTVHLKLLPGGCLYDGNNLLDATMSDDKELEELTSQLDNTIYLEMMFKFLNEDDRKEIQVIIGPVSFQFRVENEVNYKTTGRFGWYHKSLDVSFRPVDARYSQIGPNHSALDIVKVKKIITIGSSDTTTRGTTNSMNGGVKGSVPHILTLSGGGSHGWSTTKCVSDNVGYAIEKDFEETRGGFAISLEQNLLFSTLKYTYHASDYMRELDYEKLPYEDYRKFILNSSPICIPQDVKFEGTWHPKEMEYNPQVLAEYSFITSRVVYMTSKEISEKVVKKSWIKKCGHPKIQKESNKPLKYTQKYARSIFLNDAMTHLNGEKFKVEEFLHQRPLNQGEPETHLEDCSRYAPRWRANPLVGLNS